ncbi:MAG: hypothetical protein WC765_02390 [Phycisphaerae bacterium]|jgi:hypothetical protein
MESPMAMGIYEPPAQVREMMEFVFLMPPGTGPGAKHATGV